ncbi:hypothetical protein PCLA_04f0402 [Pseudomonas citronellolis]|nr:hypothetical protein PCLA_04f0402 [Pseudomonas citronellolis]
MLKGDTRLAVCKVVQNDFCPILKTRLSQWMVIRYGAELRIGSGHQCRDLIQHFGEVCM